MPKPGSAGFDMKPWQRKLFSLIMYLAITGLLWVLLRYNVTAYLLAAVCSVATYANVFSAIRHYRAYRVFGFPSLNAFRAMWKIEMHRLDPVLKIFNYDIDSATRNPMPATTMAHYCFDGLVYTIIGIVMSYYYDTLLGLPFATMYASNVLTVVFFTKGVPPSVLYFARSGDEATMFVKRFYPEMRALRLIPRCVCLLEYATKKYDHDFSVSSMRLPTADLDWKRAVSVLLKIAPIVVADLRSSSHHLKYELDQIRETNAGGKTFVLVGEARELDGITRENLKDCLGFLNVDQFFLRLKDIMRAGNRSSQFRFGKPDSETIRFLYEK